MDRTPGDRHRRRTIADASTGISRASVALYTREVPEHDERSILASLRAAAEARDWLVIAEHVDRVPAHTPMADRKEWPAVAALIERGEADGIVVPQRSHCGYRPDEDKRLDHLLCGHGAFLFPLAASTRCCRCEQLTDDPVVVREIQGASGPGSPVYACRDCAPSVQGSPWGRSETL